MFTDLELIDEEKVGHMQRNREDIENVKQISKQQHQLEMMR